jgi:UDP-2-acetamido-2,6-beta-L-arabino-hexul-4-ose reductase
MRILVTGANGFIGKNLVMHLNEQEQFSVLTFIRENTLDELQEFVEQADAIIHLAGENRPKDISAFKVVNTGLTHSLCDAIRTTGRKIPLVLASSIQIEEDNPYGKSKRAAELVVKSLANETGNPVHVYRLPGVFGKWCKPNYNSVVATFCHNIARNLPIQINDPLTQLHLVYVDDVVLDFIRVIQQEVDCISMPELKPEYSITLGELAEQIRAFSNCRATLMIERVGVGLIRALYSTYISYLPPEYFVYDLSPHCDERGVFIEMLKTPDCGQFSFFTVHPGVTRGSHYHHSKTEKFLVLSGTARIRFRNMATGDIYEFLVSSDKPQVVESIPGCVHDISNVGDCEVMVMLWANEVFDRQSPDTIPCKV